MGELLTWAATAGAGRAVELICAHVEVAEPAAADSVVVRLGQCLSVTPLALPVELLVRGVALVVVRADACSDATEASEHWAGLAEAFGLTGLVVHRDRPDAAPGPVVDADALPTVTRRGLLGLLRPAEGADPEPPHERTPHQRLRAAVAALVGPVQPDAAATGPDGVGLLLDAPACDLAGVCVQACPEDALEISSRARQATLVLDVGACSGCGTCLEVCPTDALGVVGPAPWSHLLSGEHRVVAEVTHTACERCGVHFRARTAENLCPACAFRRANPFGSALPDQVRAMLRER